MIAALAGIVLGQAQAGTLNRLAHDEIMSLLSQHLLARYSVQADSYIGQPRRIALTAATLRGLFDYVEDYLCNEIRLEDLARVARLSEDHFLRAFKVAVGQTPHQYVLSRRIARTQELLRHGKLPIGEIARQVGFARIDHLSAAFRQRVGLSPRAWRTLRRG